MTRRTFGISIAALILLCAALLVWSLRRDTGEQTAAGDSSEHADSVANVAYYTCTMHPSVRETEPGRCPSCNMDLIPVYATAAEDTEAVDLTFSVSSAKQQLIGVTFAQVRRAHVHRAVRAYGRVVPDETRAADVNLRVGGWIEDLFVDFTGRTVRQGEPLFSLYSPELLAAQSEYLVALRAARAGGSKAEGDRLVASARERLRLWQVTDARIRELEAGGEPSTVVTIVSPATGVVVEKMAVKGMRVEPGMTLYKIVDLTRVWINADVYESELSLIRVGQEVDVTVRTTPPMTLRGTVAYIDPVLDPSTRTARARVTLPNPEGRLKPEMYVEADFHLDLGERLVVPESAVLRTGKRQIAFVDKGDGVFEARLVTLGVHGEDYVEVVDGLGEGERVVTSANFLIDAEAQVQGVLRRLGDGSAPAAAPVHRH